MSAKLPAGAARLSLRIDLAPGARLGPGKVDLLERIDRTGSISAAGREMDMSYRRAWTLVETLNAMFRTPLVDSARGGSGGGGARLTEAGRRVVALYRAVESSAAGAAGADLARLAELVDMHSKQ